MRWAWWGRGPPSRACAQQIRKVAATEAPVLIGGESGSGKELAARAIHQCSQRSAGPFVAVNCGAISPSLIQSELFGHERGAFTGASSERRGLIEAANGGTIFLDEIGDLPLELQTNLLRFLQEKTINRVGGVRNLQVDVRVVAASHVDLAEAVAVGQFRDDLFYRLNVLSIDVTPLRRRMEDVPILAEYFFQRCAAKSRTRVRGFSRQAMAAMLAHGWPGNVRELYNRVQRAVVMTDRRLIGPADLGLATVDNPVGHGAGHGAHDGRARRHLPHADPRRPQHHARGARARRLAHDAVPPDGQAQHRAGVPAVRRADAGPQAAAAMRRCAPRLRAWPGTGLRRSRRRPAGPARPAAAGARSAGVQAKVARCSTTVCTGCRPARPSCSRGLREHLLLQRLALAVAGADHEGQQARAGRRAGRDRRRTGPARRRRCAAPASARPARAPPGGVDGRDGFVRQRLGAPRPAAARQRRAGGQARGLPRRTGQHHAIEGLAVDPPARGVARDGLHARARCAVARRAARSQRVGGIREQRAEVDARQQQVGAAAFDEQGVAQHAQEHLCRWRARPAC